MDDSSHVVQRYSSGFIFVFDAESVMDARGKDVKHEWFWVKMSGVGLVFTAWFVSGPVVCCKNKYTNLKCGKGCLI